MYIKLKDTKERKFKYLFGKWEYNWQNGMVYQLQQADSRFLVNFEIRYKPKERGNHWKEGCEVGKGSSIIRGMR